MNSAQVYRCDAQLGDCAPDLPQEAPKAFADAVLGVTRL